MYVLCTWDFRSISFKAFSRILNLASFAFGLTYPSCGWPRRGCRTVVLKSLNPEVRPMAAGPGRAVPLWGAVYSCNKTTPWKKTGWLKSSMHDCGNSLTWHFFLTVINRFYQNLWLLWHLLNYIVNSGLNIRTSSDTGPLLNSVCEAGFRWNFNWCLL